MIEILSFIFGGLFRLAPKFMEMREKAADRQHERDMLKLQMEADQARANAQMQAAEKQAESMQQIEELRAIVEANKAQAQQRQRTGNRWIDGLLGFTDALSNSVRPVLTYWYCVAAYGAYKVATLYLVLQSGTSFANAVTVLWTPNDHAVMFSIIGFWFVDRAIRKREGT